MLLVLLYVLVYAFPRQDYLFLAKQKSNEPKTNPEVKSMPLLLC